MSKPLKLYHNEVIVEDGELIIKNASKTTTGFLFNVGGGRTEWKPIPDMTALDQDLIDIAALSPANDDILQRKAGHWTNRTITQFKGDLVLTKSDVGLSLVDNTADLDKPISTLTQAALNLKAPITSPAFLLIPTAPTAAPGTNTTQLATTAFVTAAVSAATTGVASFKGRTGTVVPATDDYTWAQIDKTTSSFADIATRSASDINSGTLSDSRLSSNVVLLAGTQTLTNKTISGSNNTLSNIALGSLAQGGATTGQVIKWNGTAWAPAADAIGGGITDGDYGDIVVTSTGALLSIKSLAVTTAKLAALAVTDAKINDVAWTKITGKPTTISGYGITDGVTLTGSQTLTNKTLVSPVIANGSDATGDTYYRNASGIFTRLAIGTTGQVLKVVGGLPVWSTDATGGGGSLVDGDYGDVTISLSGTAINVDSGAITNAKLASVATNTFKGRITASAGAPEDLTVAQATSMLNLFSSTLKGLVPLSGGGSVNFLRADGSWAAPAVNYIFTASDFNEAGSTISIDYSNGQAASGSAKGFLTASDWLIFNNKQAALSFGGGLSELAGAVSIASSGVTTVKIADANVTDAKIVSLAWSKITSTPTTVAGYGITDAVTLTGTQTLTNKTLTSPKINLGSDATGDMYYRDASANFVRLAIGSNGQVLKIASGLPAWGTDSTGGGGDTYTGTTNRISVTGTQIDISATYPGQSSMITLGTVTTGVWNATAIAASKGGVPTGGSVGQILAKINGTDYNTQWIPAPSGANYFQGDGIIIDGENNITVDDDYIISLVGSGVTDGTKADIIVSASGTVYTVANNAITTAKILDANVTNAKLANSSITHGAPGTTGTAPNWGASSTSLGGTATLNIPLASGTGVTAGLVSKSNYDTWQAKQDALVSGTNVKTINGNSILGSGNISISGGLTDSNYGDWTVSSTGTVATINANAITTAKILDANVTNAKLANSSISHGAPGTTGTAPNWGASSTALGATATLNIPLASATSVTAGLVSKTNYDTWQAKESALTMSSGLTRSTNTITNNLSTGVSGGQTLIGSTSTTSGITYKATSGVGSTGADHIFCVGNNGATEAMRILNDGRIGIGTAAPTSGRHVDFAGNSSTVGSLVRISDASSGTTRLAGIDVATSDITGQFMAVSNTSSAPYNSKSGLYIRNFSGSGIYATTNISSSEAKVLSLEGHLIGFGHGHAFETTDYVDGDGFGGHAIIIGSRAQGGGVAIGTDAIANNKESVAIGPNTEATSYACVAIGDGTKSWAGTWSGNELIPPGVYGNQITVGDAAYSKGNLNVMIGGGAGIDHNFVLALGAFGSSTSYDSSVSTADHQGFLGWYQDTSNYFSGGSGFVNDWWIGGPVKAIYPHNISLNVTASDGPNYNGVNFNINGSRGAGTGNPGPIIFQTSTPTVAGSTVMQDLVERMRIDTGVRVGTGGTNIQTWEAMTVQSSDVVGLGVRSGGKVGYIYNNGTDQVTVDAYDYAALGPLKLRIGGNGGDVTIGGNGGNIKFPSLVSGFLQVDGSGIVSVGTSSVEYWTETTTGYINYSGTNASVGSGGTNVQAWERYTAMSADGVATGIGVHAGSKNFYMYNDGTNAAALDAYDYGTSSPLDIRVGGNGGNLTLGGNGGAVTINASTSSYALPTGRGTSGWVLTTDGVGGTSWAAVSGGGGGFTDPLTTNGDVMTHISGATNRLAAGTAGYVLTSNGAGNNISWQPIPGGGQDASYYVLTAVTTDATETAMTGSVPVSTGEAGMMELTVYAVNSANSASYTRKLCFPYRGTSSTTVEIGIHNNILVPSFTGFGMEDCDISYTYDGSGDFVMSVFGVGASIQWRAEIKKYSVYWSS